MKIESEYTIKLSRDEFLALKVLALKDFLGRTSIKDRLERNLSAKQADLLSAMFFQIANHVDPE